MNNIILLFLFIVFEINAAFSQDYVFNLMDQSWMVPDLKLKKFESDDTIQIEKTIFIRKEKIKKFIPKGWALPSYEDYTTLIASMEGQAMEDGSILVTSDYLSSIMPFRLNGIYYGSMKSLVGKNSLTGFYTAEDIDWDFNSGKEKAQVILTIASNRNGNLNVATNSSKAANGTIYCNLLFIKENNN